MGRMRARSSSWAFDTPRRDMKTLVIAMKIPAILCVGIACIAFPEAAAAAESRSCGVPELSRDSIVDIVRRARANRKNFPREAPNVVVTVSRSRCFYTYVETPKERKLGDTPVVFVIDQDGIIVDVTAGRVRSSIDCSTDTPTVEELTARLAEERAIDSSIPAAPAKAKTEIIKSGCMFLYYETPLPPVTGRYNIYTFDAKGNLYKIYVSKGGA